MLEVLTQVVDHEDLLDYVAIPAFLRERDVKVLDASDLPADWRALPVPESTKALGTRWAEAQESLALRVPSVVLPSVHNYLINPMHAAFALVEIGEAQELGIDPRLLKG